jgi:hypothetical protein
MEGSSAESHHAFAKTSKGGKSSRDNSKPTPRLQQRDIRRSLIAESQLNRFACSNLGDLLTSGVREKIYSVLFLPDHGGHRILALAGAQETNADTFGNVPGFGIVRTCHSNLRL